MKEAIREANIALEHLRTFCLSSVMVDPVGPAKTIKHLLDATENLYDPSCQPVPTALVQDITEHFHPDERLSPDRIAAIKALGTLAQREVGVLQVETSKPTTVPLADSRKGRIYVAGPMTGYEDHNFPAFNDAADALRTAGHEVINPADHGLVPGAEWADYLRADIALLSTCESVYLLRGWEKSKGAQLEVAIATSLGMPIIWQAGAQPSPLYTEADEARMNVIGQNGNGGEHY